MAGTRKARLILLLLLLVARPLSAQNDTERADSLVRLMKASSISMVEDGGVAYRKAFDATFLHNGTYFICDTALWNVDDKLINAFGHVQVIQGETILTSGKMDYFIDEDLAKFRGGVVQLENKKRNTLRTRHLDYNTKDSIGVFQNGAAMRDEDGQIIESLDGEYNSSLKVFTFSNDVNMFTDSVFVKTEYLKYNSDDSRAEFLTYIDFWKEGNMLSAGSGWYDRGAETFFFTDKVHGLGETQEVWTDSLFFYRELSDIEMYGNVQIQDTTRNSAALAGYAYYQDSLSRVTLRRDAAVALFTEQENSGRDTLYAGADEMVYWTKRMCDIDDSEIEGARQRKEDILVDPVSEYRQRAAKAAEEARAQAEREAMENDPAFAAKKKAEELRASRSAASQNPPEAEPAPEAELSPEAEPAPEPGPSPEDGGTVLPAEDSLTVSSDSLAVVPDTSRVAFINCRGNVKIFRKDIQARCDSLVYCDLDSIARLYIEPMVWNDGNRQYNSDSLFVLVKDGGVEKASLLSNAFIMVQEDSSAFDQIKGSEVIAYFDSTSALRRFDALGGASAMFYLKEEETLATVNKVASKMLSANLANGEVESVYYYEEPHNDAYPRAQVTGNDRRMKGFNWHPELKPRGKEDITPLELRGSERASYEKHPHARFTQTDIYFPGYMDKVYREIAVRDSLDKLPPEQRTEPQKDTLAVEPDTSAVVDSVAVDIPVADSLSTVTADSVEVAVAVDTSAVVVDPVPDIPDTAASVSVVSRKDLRSEEAAAKRAEAEARRAAALALREAKWARLDSLDSLKEAAKQEKLLEKKREKTRKALVVKMKRDERNRCKLEKYISIYERKKERSERKRTR